jgi:hypothetical protein
MSSAGTLLENLDAAPGPGQGNDDDLVSRIFAEMNGTPSGGNTIQLPPAPSARNMPSGQLPPVNSLTSITMDPTPATAHVIGSQNPTPADFAHAMHGTPMMMPQMAPMGTPMVQNPYAMQMGPVPVAQGGFFSSMSFSLGRELKTPLLVALIVFVIGLPVINTMIGIYMPSLLRMGGDVTMLGLALKSLLGGALFWILQRVVAPLI